MKVAYIISLLLLYVAIATTTKLPTFASLTTDQNVCEANEKRPENREACIQQPLGKLVSYPGNCSKYLVCNCVYPTVVVCPDELWFNPQIETCDWPRNVPSCNNGSGTLTTTKIITTTEFTKRTESTTPSETCDLPPGLSFNNCQNYPDGTLQRYPYNCNAYINCTQGCSVLNYCIPGKVFNVWLMICDTPDTAKCVELNLPTTTTEEITTSTEATTTTTDAITTSSEEITTSTETVTHSTLPPCKALPGVSHDVCYFTEDLLQRYPYDCKAYINCTSGCPQLDYCEAGKVFNELLLICDTPSEEYCREEQLPTMTPTVTTQPPTVPPNFNNAVCNDSSSGDLLPYAKDCASFIACVHKKPILQQCPSGYLFNPKLLICDESADVNCYDGITTLPPTTTTPIYASCVSKPYGESFPDVDNCQRYYFCWGNGTSSILHCPFENWYNPDTGNCGPEVSPEACRLTTFTTTTTTMPTPPKNACENQPANKSFPDKTNCQQYIYCLGSGASMVLPCPPKSYFNPATGNCGPGVSETACREDVTTSTTHATTMPNESTTLAPPPQLGNGICGNSSNGEIIPYPDSCIKYIVCAKLAPIAFSCPNNWQFNQSTKACDLPEHVKCDHDKSTTTPAPTWNVCQGADKGVVLPFRNNCRFFIECLGSDLWMLNSCMWGEYFDPSTHQCSAFASSNACQSDATTSLPSTDVTEITTIAPIHKSPCFGKTPGEIIAYPNNCTKYITCQTPIPVGYACQTGLEFSAEQQKCVDPDEANCSIKTTTTTTETTTTSECGSTTCEPDCRNSEPGATYPFHADCSKYIICVDGLPQIVPCMPNTFYNPQKKRCDCQTSATACFDNGESTTTEGVTTTQMTTRTTTVTESTPTKETSTATEVTPTTSQNTPTTENPMGPCYGEQDGMLVPYPYNCSKYIICLSPIAIGYDCPLGEEFNSHLKQCDLPKDANCAWTAATTADPNTTTLTTVTPDYAPDCSNAENGAVLPYPDDCSQYLICLNGQATLVNCMPGTYYNPTKGSCDSHTSETACRETATTTDNVTTEASTTSAAAATTTTQNPNTHNVCCNEPLHSVVAYPGECDRFIYCEYPIPISGRCAAHEIFDMSLLRCVPMEQGQCQDYQLNDMTNNAATGPLQSINKF